ncbi:CoA transferase subunit A [Ruminococcus sp. OA3]|nr:CoA transferase subunit A [Ruminococcus sp. OA3]
MVGGFLGCGAPNGILDKLIDKKVSGLTLICNDTAFPDEGVGKMVVNRQFTRILASHIGTNPETGRQMQNGETQVELIPQGTLAEAVRQGGAGLGGFLTPTGIGTVVEKGKQVMEIDGRKYLLEKPLRADVALIKAARADKSGNLFLAGATRNFGQIMPPAADLVIVEAEEIVEAGEIGPEHVHVPGIYVDYLVKSKSGKGAAV